MNKNLPKECEYLYGFAHILWHLSREGEKRIFRRDAIFLESEMIPSAKVDRKEKIIPRNIFLNRLYR